MSKSKSTKSAKSRTAQKRAATKTAPHVDYSPELWDRICTLIGAGKSVPKIAAMSGMPVASTIFKWASQPDKTESYTRAREAQASKYAHDIIEISDAPILAVGDMAQVELAKRRLQIDSRKWIAARLAQNLFGDKMQADVLNRHSDPSGAPLPPAAITVNFTTEPQNAV
jgi:hypothetical protein